MKKIILKCPKCGTSKIQAIPQEVIEQRKECKKGIAAIYVPEGTICRHDFLIFVDRNFAVRDASPVEDIKRFKMMQIFCLHEIEALVRKLSKKSIKKILEEI